MRGLEQIKEINEAPHAFHGEEQFGTLYHGERAAAAPDPLNDLDRAHREKVNARKAAAGLKVAADLLTDIVLSAAFETIGRRDPLAGFHGMDGIAPPRFQAPRFQGMDGINSAIDLADKSPLMKFWRDLNRQRADQGIDEAIYGEAKRAFEGGATPEGALTFIGRDGIRAVPAPGSGVAYLGEFKQIAELGNTVWRVCADKHGHSISFGTVEAALNAAQRFKDHSEGRKS